MLPLGIHLHDEDRVLLQIKANFYITEMAQRIGSERGNHRDRVINHWSIDNTLLLSSMTMFVRTHRCFHRPCLITIRSSDMLYKCNIIHVHRWQYLKTCHTRIFKINYCQIHWKQYLILFRLILKYLIQNYCIYFF